MAPMMKRRDTPDNSCCPAHDGTWARRRTERSREAREWRAEVDRELAEMAEHSTP